LQELPVLLGSDMNADTKPNISVSLATFSNHGKSYLFDTQRVKTKKKKKRSNTTADQLLAMPVYALVAVFTNEKKGRECNRRKRTTR
jgi:hypothetical protein